MIPKMFLPGIRIVCDPKKEHDEPGKTSVFLTKPSLL
ncbi:hypothetical protein BACAU_2515 [Bacillus velezensis CAU B946]|nr:hypothetical protein BACAU_2515 [Bacillus velezensis CAU B946]